MAVAAPGKPPKRIVFPVVGKVTYFDDYGDPRPQGSHDGVDILAPRRALAVAAEAGRVEFERSANGAAGCMLYLHGTSGTTYLYVHLNNDLRAANDNRGRCVPGVAFARGLATGDRVEAGTPVGYVGNSGDADGGSPHLHFELHPAGRAPTNPYPYLRGAEHLLFPAPAGMTVTLALTGTVLSATEDRARVLVEVLRASALKLKLSNLNRAVSVTTSGAVVEPANPDVSLLALPSVKKGQRVIVFTAPTPVSPSVQLGRAGALVAERVVVLPAR